jgi:hypothetical protein
VLGYGTHGTKVGDSGDREWLLMPLGLPHCALRDDLGLRSSRKPGPARAQPSERSKHCPKSGSGGLWDLHQSLFQRSHFQDYILGLEGL